jgi:two-component system nitrogen regulation sensor histidine kinase NtrY
LVRSATLERLGQRTRALSVQPIQGTLDTVEMAAQTDLVRVLTHEILNSLTPVTSLAATAADLLADPALSADPRVGDARMAVLTLARRAQGLSNFIEAYRAVAQPPEMKRQVFAAPPGPTSWRASSRPKCPRSRWRSRSRRTRWRSTPIPICWRRC